MKEYQEEKKERYKGIGYKGRCFKGHPHGWMKCVKLAAATENSWESRMWMPMAGANAHMGYSCVFVWEKRVNIPYEIVGWMHQFWLE